MINIDALRLLVPPNGDGSVTLRTARFLELLDELQHARELLDAVGPKVAELALRQEKRRRP